MAVPVCAAQAATFTVDRLDDLYDSQGSACSGEADDCSLRGAVNKANDTAGVDTIDFDASVFATRQTITLCPLIEGTSSIIAFPTLSSDLNIIGPAMGVNLRTSQGNPLLITAKETNISLAKLNFSGTSVPLYNYGDTTIVNCSFSAAYLGTGISNNGTLTVRDSTISSDQYALVNYGTATLERSLIAYTKYAISNYGTLTLRNSTVGGAYSFYGSFGDVTADSCTILSDTSRIGAVKAAKISNSIFRAGNRFYGDGGHNLFGDEVNGAGLDPAGLKDNGGPTLTVALLADGSAIDAGQTSLSTDQRGGARLQGNAADIGAYEVQKGAPNVKVALSPSAPKTNDVLTATPTVFSGGSVSYDYQWFRNGAQIPNETESTLQLSKTGNGDKGDVISVIVRATDSQGTSAPASAQVTVVNSAPVAISSQGEVPAATEKAFVLNAADADGDAFTFQRVGGPRNGVADIRVDPTDGKTKLFYQSRPFYGGVDVIRFVARDSEGKLSNESTLGINVQYTPPPANRAPIAGDTSIDTFVGKLEIKGLLGSDPDGDALTFRIVNNAKYGTSEIKRDEDGQFKLFYSSLNRFYGLDRVTYLAIDSRGKESNLATVNINFLNRAPRAQNSELAVTSGALVSKYLFGTDDDGDALTFKLVNNPRYGTGEIKRDEDGKWRVYYQAAPGYVGPDRLTFIAIDPMGRQSQVATASINIVRGNRAPNALQAAPRPSGGAS